MTAYWRLIIIIDDIISRLLLLPGNRASAIYPSIDIHASSLRAADEIGKAAEGAEKWHPFGSTFMLYNLCFASAVFPVNDLKWRSIVSKINEFQAVASPTIHDVSVMYLNATGFSNPANLISLRGWESREDDSGPLIPHLEDVEISSRKHQYSETTVSFLSHPNAREATRKYSETAVKDIWAALIVHMRSYFR